MQLIAAFTRARTCRLLAGIVERVIMIFLVTPRTQLLAFLWTHWRACAGHTGVWCTGTPNTDQSDKLHTDPFLL